MSLRGEVGFCHGGNLLGNHDDDNDDYDSDDADDGDDDDDKLKNRHSPAVSAKPEVTLRALTLILSEMLKVKLALTLILNEIGHQRTTREIQK